MNSECMKCNGWMSPVEEVYGTSCGHLFHKKCLTEWVDRGSDTCPCCPEKLCSAKVFLLSSAVPNAIQQSSLLDSCLDASEALVSYQKDLFKKHDKEFKALKNKTKEQEQELHEHKKKTEELQQNYEELYNKMAEDKALHEKQILDLQTEMKSLKEDLKKKDLILSALAQNNETQNEKMEQFKKEKKTLGDNVESLTRQVNERDERLRGEETKIKQLTDKIDEHMKENQELNNNNKTLQEVIKKLNGELSAVNRKLARRDMIIAGRRVVKQEQVNIIGANDSKVTEIKNDLKMLKSQLDLLLREKAKESTDGGGGEGSRRSFHDDSNCEDDSGGRGLEGYFVE